MSCPAAVAGAGHGREAHRRQLRPPGRCAAVDSARVHDDAERHHHEEREHPRPDERHQRLCLLRLSTMRTRARTRSSSVETSYSGDAGLLGRVAGSRASRVPARPRRSGGGTRDRWCRPTAARRSPRPRRRSSRRRAARARAGRRGGSRSPRGARSAGVIARSQPGSLMKSEIDEHQRASPGDAARRPRSGRLDRCCPLDSAAAAAARGRVAAPGVRPLRGGIVRSTALLYRMAPTRLPPRVSTRASVVATSISTVSFGRSVGPKPIDGERSSSSQAVSSRSSRNVRTWATSMRAVTFQSMWRTSSPGSYSRRSATSTPDAAEHRAVVALELPVESADHPPLQATQQSLRRLDGRWRHRRRLGGSRSGTSGTGIGGDHAGEDACRR